YGDTLIGIIQPKDRSDRPELFTTGRIGRIDHADPLPDGPYNILLQGTARFRIKQELDVETPYRQVLADHSYRQDESAPAALAGLQRADLERETRRYAETRGFSVDWNAIARLDDEMLVNGVCQIVPLDVGSKQALLESPDLVARSDLL